MRETLEEYAAKHGIEILSDSHSSNQGIWIVKVCQGTHRGVGFAETYESALAKAFILLRYPDLIF